MQNHSDGNLKVRLVGHSAGCLVANRVTQLVKDMQYGIEEVVLCAPPVPDNANKFGLHWTKNEIKYAFPDLQSIAGGKFMYIPVKKDNVLSVHNVGTRYDSDFVSTHYGSVSAASVVPPDHLILSRRHWHPVSYTNWVRYYLEWYRDVSQIEFAPRNIVLTAKRRKVHI